MPSFGALLQSASTAPSIYRAARGAGASHRQAWEIMATSAAALETAARIDDPAPGEINAVRHFIWSAYMTANFGEQIAGAVTNAHEVGAVEKADSRVDQKNNATARAYASAHRDEIKAWSVVEAMSKLTDIGRDLWQRDELVWVKPH